MFLSREILADTLNIALFVAERCVALRQKPYLKTGSTHLSAMPMTFVTSTHYFQHSG